jgi:predicted heme/steroid binding protein
MESSCGTVYQPSIAKSQESLGIGLAKAGRDLDRAFGSSELHVASLNTVKHLPTAAVLISTEVKP